MDALVLVKLNRVLSCIALGDKAQAFAALVDMVKAIFPCDAAVLLQRYGDKLVVEAQQGLNEDSRLLSFTISEQPRLNKIMSSKQWVRFDAGSKLADPYDNLVENYQGPLPVHDCMGTSLYDLSGNCWGALTFDTLTPKAFDSLDANLLNVVTELASLCLGLERNLDSLSRTRESLLPQSNEILGASNIMDNLRDSIRAVAETELSVLILGESGTGKELIAQNIHQNSRLKDSVYVTLNCATMPSELAESELFGHEKGAFTGADKTKRGKFELADGGTLFLDEIGELPFAMQAKLLRALQQGEIQRLGSEATIVTNCRIIAATNRNLSDEVGKGRFREDLYHRLNVYPITSPPLRVREGDILVLLEHFTTYWRSKIGVAEVIYSVAAQKAVLEYNWPGNVRELENFVARLLVTLKNKYGEVLHVDASDILLDSRSKARDQEHRAEHAGSQLAFDRHLTLKEQTEAYQKAMIIEALNRSEGNWSRSAQELGLDRANLARLAKRLQVKI
jgi:anaerobic nitric oxide reductase transcription regulator